MKIRILVPVLYSELLAEKAAAEYRAAAGDAAEISLACLPNGTATIESDLDIALAQPETVRLAEAAAADGIDACIIACFSDPGGDGARERTPIPVIGEGQAAMQLAAMLSSRFSVITTWKQCVPRIRRLVMRAGLRRQLASVHATDMGVMALSNDCCDLVGTLALRAIREDGAEAVVLGCTGTGENMGDTVAAKVREALGVSVPIIDPVKAALAAVLSSHGAGLSHSAVAFPPAAARPEYRFAGVAQGKSSHA